MASQLFVFIQGSGEDGQLWYNSSPDGQTWLGNQQVPGLGMSESPSAVVFNDLYCFHQGSGQNGQLWYRDYAQDRQLTNTNGLSASPSSAVFNNTLYCFHQGPGQNGKILYNTSTDGASWSSDQSLSSGISEGPSAVVFNNSLYCFHQGAYENGQLIYNVSTDGKTWPGGDNSVGSNAAIMSESPSAVVFNSKLYCFYQGPGNNGQLMYSVLTIANNKPTWAVNKQVPNTGISASPSAVVFNGSLYCFHQGAYQNGQLIYNTSTDGSSWSGDQVVPNAIMSEGPSAVVVSLAQLASN